MTISVLGLLMVILTIIVFVYLGVSAISSTITSTIDTGAGYEDLSHLNEEYKVLSNEFDTTQSEVISADSDSVRKAYVDAELKIDNARLSISEFKSALDSKQPQKEIAQRLKKAQDDLVTAKNSLSALKELI